jgi:CRP-like cAMP-binding protein
METVDLSTHVGSTWFGSAMSTHCLTTLAGIARAYEAPAGAQLLAEGDHTPELSLLIKGRVTLSQRMPGREPVILMTVEAGDIFGWTALLPPYAATSTVTATEPVEVIAFDGTRLRKAVGMDALLAACVYRQALDAVARRLFAAFGQMLDVYRADTAG